MSNLFIGLLSGTSMDAVDAALVDFADDQPRLINTYSQAFSDELRDQLRALGHPQVDELERFAQLDMRMGQIFAEAANILLQQADVKADQVRAIGSHGQTVRHQPSGPFPFSLQIGNPALIAERTGITTVADFRGADIAAGGQGAPLVPAFHNALFRSSDSERVIVNVGGIANITILPADREKPVGGFDTGPGNTLMDAWAYQHLKIRMDEGGDWAARGEVSSRLLTSLMSDPYFTLTPPKSTGPEYLNLPWLAAKLSLHQPAGLSAQDVQATLCELTATSIAEAILHHAPLTQEVLVCGGGVHNRTLMQRLAALMPGRKIASTGAHGVDPNWVEAMAFAWLAKQTLAGKSGNLPSVTGAQREVVLGGVYKASTLLEKSVSTGY